MAKKRKVQRLIAVEKSKRALQKLKLQKWIFDFGMLAPNSLDDSLGYDAWISFQYNGCKQGKFPFQILSKDMLARKHTKKHCGVPHISIRKADNMQNAVYRYVLFLYVHGALNEDKIRGLEDGMSFLCPMKRKKLKF